MCSDHIRKLNIFSPHTHPKSLDSGNSVKTFIKSAAKDFGHKSIAVTDHGTMGAIIEAHEYSKELKKKEGLDIKIIPGIELYLKPDPDDDSGWAYYHVTVHFNDFDAYLEGCKLSRPAFERGTFKGGELKPLTTWQELESLSGKITIGSSCLIGSFLRPWLKGRKDISERNFVRLMNIAGPGKFFAEIFPYEVSKNWDRKTKTFVQLVDECAPSGALQVDANKWTIYMAQKYNVPMVISEDAHYAHESEKFVQDSRLSNNKSDGWRMADANCLHTSEWLLNELCRIHPDYMTEYKFEAMVDNSWLMESTFKGFEPKFKPSLPKVVVERISGNERKEVELTEDNELTEHTLNLIVEKGRVDLSNPIYTERLNKELKQLSYNGKVNVLPYMLFLTDIIDFCNKNDVLVGVGRGSAAGSCIAYALGLTEVDPIIEDLSFERFFDVTRVEEGLADIDTDFSDRGKVVDYIKSKYGDKFAYLGIGITFKTKSALKDIDRHIYGEVRKETESVCKTIATSPQGVDEEKFLRGYTDEDGHYHTGELESNSVLRDFLAKYPIIEDNLFKMIGIERQNSVHACGVLVANKPVHEFIPLTKIGDEFATQLLPKWVEKCGGIKYDILGLSTLEDIRGAINLIKKEHGITINPWKIEDNYEMWEAAINDPSSVFQLHTPTVRKGLQTMRPHNIQEGSILTAVFRPGAMDAVSDEDPNKMMSDIFLERWTGQRPVKYIHPDLEPILKPTAATIVFQEQIMRIVNELGGLTMPETNKLRKAISKKDSEELITLLNKVKVNLALRGWTEGQAHDISEQMKASGKYCFNKSHAISYTYIARACIYLKYHYPLEWWTSVLSNADKDDLKTFWQKMSHLILPPDINLSTDKFQIVDIKGERKILSPLNVIEGVGPSVIAELTSKRPFNDFDDLMSKVEKRIVNKGKMLKLIFSKILDPLMSASNIPNIDIDKISYYLQLKAKLEGKSTPETVPIEYFDMTPIKEYLMKKSVFKVYSGDLVDITAMSLVNKGKIKRLSPNSSSYLYKMPDESTRIVVKKKTLDEEMESTRPTSIAIIGYVSSVKEPKYANDTKNRLVIKVDIEDREYEFIKWPKWKANTHGVADPFNLEDSVCIITMSRWKEGGEIFIDNIEMIENLSFLKDSKKENEENEQPTTRKPKSKTTKRRIK